MKAEDKMKSPYLLYFILEEMHKQMAGQDIALISGTTKIMLRLVQNAVATSSNLLVSDATGAGKDVMVAALCNVLCEKENTYLHRTKISPQTFNYWQPKDPVTNKPTTWDGKVLYLEDPEAGTLKHQAFKVMASGGTTITVVKDQKIIDREIDGKPVLIITSFKEDIDDEGARRYSILRLENGDAFLGACRKFTIKLETGNLELPDNALRALLKTLRSYDVNIPKVEKIIQCLPLTAKMNTQKNNLLDYIRASTVMHQYDRKTDDSILIATDFDIYLGAFVFCALGDYSDHSLSVQEDYIYKILNAAHDKPTIKHKGTEYTVTQKGLKTQDIANITGLCFNTTKDKLDGMQNKGIVIGFTYFDALSNKNVQFWKVDNDFFKRKYTELEAELIKNGIKRPKKFDLLMEKIDKNREKQGLSSIFDAETGDFGAQNSKKHRKTRVKTGKNAEKQAKIAILEAF